MGLVGAKGELSNIIEIMENAKKKKMENFFPQVSIYIIKSVLFFTHGN